MTALWSLKRKISHFSFPPFFSHNPFQKTVTMVWPPNHPNHQEGSCWKYPFPISLPLIVVSSLVSRWSRFVCVCVRVSAHTRHYVWLSVFSAFFLPPNGRMSPTLFMSNTQSGWFTTAAPYLHIQPEIVLMTINFWLQAKKKDGPKLFNTTSRIHRGVTTVMKAAI